MGAAAQNGDNLIDHFIITRDLDALFLFERTECIIVRRLEPTPKTLGFRYGDAWRIYGGRLTKYETNHSDCAPVHD